MGFKHKLDSSRELIYIVKQGWCIQLLRRGTVIIDYQCSILYHKYCAIFQWWRDLYSYYKHWLQLWF